MTTQRRAWKALISTVPVHIAGQDILIGKVGVPTIASIAAAHPGVGDIIETLMADRAKGKSTTVESLAKAAAEVADREGLPAGKVARLFLSALPSIITDLVVAAVVLTDDEERAEFREWFGSLGLADTINALMAWVGHNLPEAAGPLGEVLARVGIFFEELPSILGDLGTKKSDGSESEPGSEQPSAPALAA